MVPLTFYNNMECTSDHNGPDSDAAVFFTDYATHM